MRDSARETLRSEGLSGRRVGFGLAAEGARLVPSLVTFAIVPRALGAAKYGQLAALLAMCALLAALSTIGAHITLVRSLTTRSSPEREAVGRALTTTVMGGIVGILAGVPLGVVLFPRLNVATIVLLFTAEMLFGNLLHVFSGLAIVQEDQKKLAIFVVVFAGARVLATVIYAMSALRGSLTGFAIMYFVAVSSASFVCVLVEHLRGSWPGAMLIVPRRAEITSGLAIASMAGVFYAQDGLDTPIIVRSGFSVDAGTYASAYRVVSLAFAPVNALVLLGLPRLVSRDDATKGREHRTTMRLTLFGVAYGIAVFVGVMVAAPLVPLVLGHEFARAAKILRWLALLPLLRATQYFVANNLMLNGAHRSRLIVQVISAAASVVAYIALIPRYSWRGAVAGTYVSEVLLAVGLWVVFVARARLARAEQGQLVGALAA